MPEIDGLPMIECIISQEWFRFDVCVKVPANALRKKAEWFIKRCAINLHSHALRSAALLATETSLHK